MRHTLLLKLAIVRDGRRGYEIARLAGMTETRLSRLACGRAVPSEAERERLAKILGVPAISIFSPNETPPSAA